MNIPDHISESLETIFWVKNTEILGCGSGSGIRNLFDPGSEPKLARCVFKMSVSVLNIRRIDSAL